MKRLQNCLLAILWPAVSCYAQSPTTNIHPIKIGESVPDIEFSRVINYTSESICLSDFKGKLIILDFWATWCNSCHARFPKADSLQEMFKDQVQIILVNSIRGTGDSAAKIQRFFENWNQKHAQTFRLPTAIEDTITKILFPRTYLPHYIWISKEGKLAAVTSSDEVTVSNIMAMLSGCSITLSNKKQKR